MNYIDIDVLVHNDSTKLMDSLDLDFDLDSADIKNIRLYSISFIMPYEDNGKEYTQIFVDGQSFISPYRYEDMQKIIDILFR